MVVAVVLLALAYALGSGVIPTLGSNLATGLAAVAASWLAWIVMLAYCALAAQYRLKSVAARKVILSIGAISTALPWFGIYAAHMMAEE